LAFTTRFALEHFDYHLIVTLLSPQHFSLGDQALMQSRMLAHVRW